MKYFFFLVVIFMYGCNNPLEKKFDLRSFEKDALHIIESKQLDEKDIDRLGRYIFESRLSGKDLSEFKYSEILLQAKGLDIYKFDHKNEIISDLSLDKVLIDHTSMLNYYKAENSNNLDMELVYENKTNKPIVAVVGCLEVPNLGVVDVCGLTAKFQEVLKPGNTQKAILTIPYNPFNIQVRNISDKVVSEVKYRWILQEIVYKNSFE